MLEGLDRSTISLLMHWLPLSARMLLLRTSSDLARIAAPAPDAEASWDPRQAAYLQTAATSGQLLTAARAVNAAVSVVVTGDNSQCSRPLAAETGAAQPRNATKATTILFRSYLTVQMAIAVHRQALSNLEGDAGDRPKYGDEHHLPMEEATAWHLQLKWADSALFAVHATIRLTWLACMGDISFWQEAICIQQLCSERACCMLLPIRAYLLLLDVVAVLARVCNHISQCSAHSTAYYPLSAASPASLLPQIYLLCLCHLSKHQQSKVTRRVADLAQLECVICRALGSSSGRVSSGGLKGPGSSCSFCPAIM